MRYVQKKGLRPSQRHKYLSSLRAERQRSTLLMIICLFQDQGLNNQRLSKRCFKNSTDLTPKRSPVSACMVGSLQSTSRSGCRLMSWMIGNAQGNSSGYTVIVHDPSRRRLSLLSRTNCVSLSQSSALGLPRLFSLFGALSLAAKKAGCLPLWARTQFCVKNQLHYQPALF